MTSPVTLNAVNGVATFTLQSSSSQVAGNTDVVSIGLPNNTSSWMSKTITATAATATALQLKAAPTYITPGATNLTLQVVDQAGDPMPAGNSYIGILSLTGDATFTNGAGTGPEAVSLSPSGTVSVTVPTGATGSVGITGSINGSTSIGNLNVSLPIVTPGTAAKLGYQTAPSTTSFSADAIGATGGVSDALALEAEDANGIFAPATAPIAADITPTVMYNGATSTDVQAAVTSGGTGIYDVTLSKVSGATAIPAGTYTLTLKDSSGTLASYSQTFTITAGAPNTVKVTPAVGTTYDVSTSSPSATVTAQLEDAWGNPVSEAGVPITFTAAGTNAPTLNNGQTGPLDVLTNANGVATVTATEPATLSDTGDVTAVIDAANWAAKPSTDTPSTTAVSSATLDVTNVAVNQVTAAAQYTGTATSYTASASATPKIIANFYDSGVPVSTSDYYTYTITGPNNFSYSPSTPLQLSSASTATITPSITGGLTTAGTYTVKVTDLSSPAQPSATTTFVVSPASFAGFALIDSTGNNATQNGETLSAGQSASLMVTPVDAFGNVVVSPDTYQVALPSDSNAAFSSTVVTVGAGSSGAPVTVTGLSNDTGTLAKGDFVISQATPIASSVTFTPGNYVYSSGSGSSPSPLSEVITVKDANGNVLANQTVVLSLGSTHYGTFAGGGSSVTVTTNSSGQAAFVYDPAANNSTTTDVDTVSATIPAGISGGSATSLTGTWTVTY